MNIQNLKYALEINRKKSISKAAKSLYVAQPNLSKLSCPFFYQLHY